MELSPQLCDQRIKTFHPCFGVNKCLNTVYHAVCPRLQIWNYYFLNNLRNIRQLIIIFPIIQIYIKNCREIFLFQYIARNIDLLKFLVIVSQGFHASNKFVTLLTEINHTTQIHIQRLLKSVLHTVCHRLYKRSPNDLWKVELWHLRHVFLYLQPNCLQVFSLLLGSFIQVFYGCINSILSPIYNGFCNLCRLLYCIISSIFYSINEFTGFCTYSVYLFTSSIGNFSGNIINLLLYRRNSFIYTCLQFILHPIEVILKICSDKHRTILHFFKDVLHLPLQLKSKFLQHPDHITDSGDNRLEPIPNIRDSSLYSTLYIISYLF